MTSKLGIGSVFLSGSLMPEFEQFVCPQKVNIKQKSTIISTQKKFDASKKIITEKVIKKLTKNFCMKTKMTQKLQESPTDKFCQKKIRPEKHFLVEKIVSAQKS